MREAGAEITRTLADSIATDVSSRITSDARVTLAEALYKHLENTQKVLDLHHDQVSHFVDIGRDAVIKTHSGSQNALAQAGSLKTIAAELRDVMHKYFLVFTFLPVVAMLVGICGGAILAWRYDHTAVYHQGWTAGAGAYAAHHPGRPRK